MGKHNNLEVKNLFFSDFDSLFNKTIKEAIKVKNISEEEAIKKIAPKLEEMRSLYEDRMATFYLSNHKFDINKFLSSHLKNQETIVRKNEHSFTPFLIYVNACVNIYDKATNGIEKKRVSPTLRVTISLYGLVIRRAQQIADLLLNGYVDAAMIVWRSMYENAVTLLVLALEDSTELSKRFFDHSVRQSKRKISSYVDNHQALGFKPLPKKVHSMLARKKQRLTTRYGKDFLENDYGWADQLGKGRITFRTLEDKSGLSRFRPYYILCSEQIHTSLNGLERYFENKKLILPRLLRQEIELKSFIDPMQFTVSILHEVNDYIIWQFSTETERSANMLLLRKAFDKLQQSFDSTSSNSIPTP